MALIGPILDDRTYEQLRDELVRRIPVYTPEWTDHNESDPGIALLELFAYLGEIAALPVQPDPRQPPRSRSSTCSACSRGRPQVARALLAACRPSRPQGVHVPTGDRGQRGRTSRSRPRTRCTSGRSRPRRRQAAARGRSSADPTTSAAREQHRRGDARRWLPARADFRQPTPAADVLPASSRARRPVPAPAPVPRREPRRSTSRCGWPGRQDAPTSRPSMLGRHALRRRRLRRGAARRPFDLVDATARRPAAGRLADTLTARPAGGAAGSCGPGRTRRPTTRGRAGRSSATPPAGMTTTGVVQLELPGRFPAHGPRSRPGRRLDRPPPLDDAELAARVVAWLQVARPRRRERRDPRAVAGSGSTPSESSRRRPAAPELLGTGTGEPGQRYQLAQRPVLAGTVELEVEEDDGWTRWTEVETLARAEPDDPHFTVDPQAGLVTFGTRSRVPQLGERIRVVLLPVRRRRAGNVPAGAITPLTGVAAVKVTNLLPRTGGATPRRWPRPSTRSPREVHRRDRAVTAEDFRALALRGRRRAPGRDAAAVPPRHPGPCAAPAWSASSSFPTEDLRNPGAPLPDLGLLRRVAAYLDPRRLVTTELYVIPPTYREIAVSVGVQRPGRLPGRRGPPLGRADPAPVPRAAAAVRPERVGLAAGRAVRRAELEAVAVQVDGVEYVDDDLQLARRSRCHLADGAGGDPQRAGRCRSCRPSRWSPGPRCPSALGYTPPPTPTPTRSSCRSRRRCAEPDDRALQPALRPGPVAAAATTTAPAGRRTGRGRARLVRAGRRSARPAGAGTARPVSPSTGGVGPTARAGRRRVVVLPYGVRLQPVRAKRLARATLASRAGGRRGPAAVRRRAGRAPGAGGRPVGAAADSARSPRPRADRPPGRRGGRRVRRPGPDRRPGGDWSAVRGRRGPLPGPAPQPAARRAHGLRPSRLVVDRSRRGPGAVAEPGTGRAPSWRPPTGAGPRGAGGHRPRGRQPRSPGRGPRTGQPFRVSLTVPAGWDELEPLDCPRLRRRSDRAPTPRRRSSTPAAGWPARPAARPAYRSQGRLVTYRLDSRDLRRPVGAGLPRRVRARRHLGPGRGADHRRRRGRRPDAARGLRSTTRATSCTRS